MTDLDRQILKGFYIDANDRDSGMPASLVAQDLGLPTAKVTKAAKDLAARGLLRDTGWAMKINRRTGQYDYTETEKNEAGMLSKPGASTVWAITDSGISLV